MTEALSPNARAFIDRLGAALASLPADVRADIVREIESHLAEREAAGHADAALAALGPPEALAQPYLQNHILTLALARPNPLSLLFAVLNRAGRSVLAFAFGSIAALLYLFALAFAALIALKAITPNNVGWWVGQGHFQFGAIYGGHAPGPERLGLWILPIALGGAVGCYTLARMLLKLVSRMLLKRGSGFSAAAF